MNKVELTGHLTADAEFSQTANGNDHCSFRLAVKRPFSEKASFINIDVWGKSAENCSKYLKKGDKVGVVGWLRTSTYEDKNGITKYSTNVVAEDVEFLVLKNFNTIHKEEQELKEIDEDEKLPF